MILILHSIILCKKMKIFFIVKIYFFVSVWEEFAYRNAGAHGFWNKAMDPLVLELQVTNSHLTDVRN